MKFDTKGTMPASIASMALTSETGTGPLSPEAGPPADPAGGGGQAPGQAAAWIMRARLRPLWLVMTHAVPQSRLPVLHRTADARYHLHRRVTEIRDAALALHPYCDTRVAAQAAAAAGAAGQPADITAAAAETAMLLDAISARAQSRPVPPGLAPAAASVPCDLGSEAARLVLIAGMLRCPAAGAAQSGPARPAAGMLTAARIRRCADLARSLDIPSPWDLHGFLRIVGARRRRPVVIDTIGGPGPSAMWTPQLGCDYIYVHESTTPWHRGHLAVHEAAHILLGHVSGGARISKDGQLTVPRQQTAASPRQAGPSYEDPRECEAELLASMILARSCALPAAASAPWSARSGRGLPGIRLLQSSSGS
jgi:hypothetical protein